MKRHNWLAALLLAGGVALAAAPALSAEIAVVDTQKLFTQSAPAKAGEQHLQSVQASLQKSLDELRRLYKGREKEAETQRILAQGQATLQQRLNLHRQAVLQEVSRLAAKASETWLAGARGYLVVLPRQSALAASQKIDATSAILKEMNKLKPEFPAAPKVNIAPPAQGKSK